ncbi:MAG: Ferric enterobactin receptor [Paracidovorax wautersii]|uniref:Ferric enterobactin receptor n=1 Tax=Paracidovorax wautersii TaxID=1177982 RepID=A0A7V8FM81_9BURK|nr:MAG: Ferric enterobactin receptor [Paracidovorax wautersii]
MTAPAVPLKNLGPCPNKRRHLYQGSYRYFQWTNAGKAVVHGLEGNFNVPILGASGNRLKLLNNFTWMFKNKSKSTGQPLSIIPKYTVNSTLDWQATQKLSAQATATFYGPQEPRTLTARGANATGSELDRVGSYAVFGLGGTYEFNKNYRTSFGVTNLLDKVIKRRSNSTSGGAFTYNEPGRAYYVSFTGSF